MKIFDLSLRAFSLGTQTKSDFRFMRIGFANWGYRNGRCSILDMFRDSGNTMVIWNHRRSINSQWWNDYQIHTGSSYLNQPNTLWYVLSSQRNCETNYTNWLSVLTLKRYAGNDAVANSQWTSYTIQRRMYQPSLGDFLKHKIIPIFPCSINFSTTH